MADSYHLGPDYSIALVVGDVVPQAEVSVGVHPPVRAYDATVLQPLFLAVLTADSLVSEESFWTLVSLDVVLGIRRRVPPSYFCTGLPVTPSL